MNTDDLILISVDDHVVEPPDMFQNHLPAKYKDAAPRVVVAEDGSDVWLYEGQQLPNIGLNAVAGKPHEEYGIEPTTFAEMRTGCYDIHDRVKDMNANGVLGSMCFPSFPQFCGQLFARTQDKQVALAMLQAYNDWHVDEWCGSYPGRFIPLALPPVWDPQLMAAEVHRMAAKGCRAVTFSENPEKLGWPSFHNEHWDPFWQAVSDTGTVVCLHIGSSSQLTITSVEAPINVMISLQPMNLVQAAADLLWSRVMTEFPLVRFALSEGGIGWIPYFLERVDYVYEHHQAWTGQDLPMKPSELFKERFITCFIDDASGLKNREDVGIKQMTWECDYPHSDSTWPESPERLAKSLAGIPDDEIRAITYENAMRLFHYDPFAHLPVEESTVAA
ncbi:MAG: amidohydrolase family protein, partial [Actinobacteria bacterium]|nr:amidohydrolase family protein [Actinomycetota bacterium]